MPGFEELVLCPKLIFQHWMWLFQQWMWIPGIFENFAVLLYLFKRCGIISWQKGRQQSRLEDEKGAVLSYVKGKFACYIEFCAECRAAFHL